MKVGDMVKWNRQMVVVVEIYESKCWRTSDGPGAVNWVKIPNEPFARIYARNGVIGVPQIDLEVIKNVK